MESLHLCIYALVIVIIIVRAPPPVNQSKFYIFTYTYLHIGIVIVTQHIYVHDSHRRVDLKVIDKEDAKNCVDVFHRKLLQAHCIPGKRMEMVTLRLRKRAEHIASVHHLSCLALVPFVHEYSLESF